MEKQYRPEEVEGKTYKYWEDGGYFTPSIQKNEKKTTEPFTILLPPPNANAPLHMGHAMYVVEDILARFHRMKGEPTLFLPGMDHAGIETQFVFEKKLKEKGKSRFDFDRETLYSEIFKYVEENRGIAKNQMKQLGFSLDWTREKFTLDPKILETINETFRKLYKEGLVYRAEKIVNYCTRCGTGFSELEVERKERLDSLYFLDYWTLTIATTRPETIFSDVAIAVNPNDPRYQKLIGKSAIVPIIEKKIPIVADEDVQIDFGTGALKITPAHDPTDFEIGKRHNLDAISCIDLSGKMINTPDFILGLYPKQAREKTVEKLKADEKIKKIEPITHNVGICYRCKNVIEPLLLPQWYVKVGVLAEPALESVRSGKIKIFPERFIKLYTDWFENIKDWNISRQVVWGPRIPAWYCLDCNPEIKLNFLDKEKKAVTGFYKDLKDSYSFEEIKLGLQSLVAPVGALFSIKEGVDCGLCGKPNSLQETDTFDTWFSSGQWPLTTLGYPDKDDFKYFYPASVLDTMWDILFFWVGRMVMFGLYLTKEVPFKVIHLHSRVVDTEHKKMSKSKGNVIDPIEMVKKYGADALRFSLVFGTAPASDVVVSEEKIMAMRNFANKIWNMGRYILFQFESYAKEVPFFKDETLNLNEDDKLIIDKLDALKKHVTKALEEYQFSYAAEALYEFSWHEFADKYIELSKSRPDREVSLSVLRHVYLTLLKLLHPFMPFITEEIWAAIPKRDKTPLIVTSWPH